MMEKEIGAKHKLDFSETSSEKKYLPREGTPPPPPSAREQKRSKKHSTPKMDKNMTIEAASETEGRQSK